MEDTPVTRKSEVKTKASEKGSKKGLKQNAEENASWPADDTKEAEGQSKEADNWEDANRRSDGRPSEFIVCLQEIPNTNRNRYRHSYS